MPTKKELIQAHKDGKIKPIAVCFDGHMNTVILHIEYGINEKVFGYEIVNNKRKYFYTKIQGYENQYFIVRGYRYNLNEFVRVGSAWLPYYDESFEE